MKILILGAAGQVGFELNRSLAPLGTIFSPTRAVLDLSNADTLDEYLNNLKPELIVNAAAWTAVDDAEKNRAACQRLNEGLPKQLARYAAKQGITIVHYSSDYVYPGDGTIAWQEDSPTSPENYYGYTKLQGDMAVQDSGADHLIFRTSWVYSARGKNFMKTMLGLGKDRQNLNVVADQIGVPTPARLIAQITTLALYAKIESGVYHLVPKGEVSWHGFASVIFDIASKAGVKLAIKPKSLNAVPASQYPTPAKRPLNSRLATDKLESALGIQLPDWRSQLNLTLTEFLEK